MTHVLLLSVCVLCRFDGKKMLKILRGKRLVFVGDSLNRNMWESLVCSLRSALEDKNRVSKVSWRRSNLRNEGFYGFRFKVSNVKLSVMVLD